MITAHKHIIFCSFVMVHPQIYTDFWAIIIIMRCYAAIMIMCLCARTFDWSIRRVYDIVFKAYWHCFQSILPVPCFDFSSFWWPWVCMTCITNTEHHFLPILCVDFSAILIDYNLYRKFWSLQDYFRKPVQCFDKAAWRAFAMVYFFTTSYQPWPDGPCFPTMTMEEQKSQNMKSFNVKSIHGINAWDL